MKNKLTTRHLVLLGLLTAVLLVLAYTPLGYLRIGIFSITINAIPVAIAAYSMGPKGGAVIGAVFGLTSFLQVFNGDPTGTALFAISPILTVIVCFLPRALDGFLCGIIADLLKKRKLPALVTGAVTGLSAALLNTVFFLTGIVVLFGNSDYIKELREALAPGKNVLIFLAVVAGVNAIAEWVASTLVTGAIGAALHSAKLIDAPSQKAEA